MADIFGFGLANTESQRSEYGESGDSLDSLDRQSVTVYTEMANIKINAEYVGSPTITIFIINHLLSSNVGSTNLGGYHSNSFNYQETFVDTTYKDTSTTTAQWTTTGSLTY